MGVGGGAAGKLLGCSAELGTSVSSPESSSSHDSATTSFFLDVARDVGGCAFMDSLFSVDSSSVRYAWLERAGSCVGAEWG